MRRNLINVVFEKYLPNSGTSIYKVIAKDRLIGYFIKPEEVYISINDPFIIEKIENISDEAKKYLMSKLNVSKKEDKLKKTIAVSYFLRCCRIAGLSKVIIDGVEYNLPQWDKVKILPEYFYVPKCQKYCVVDYRCVRCCGWTVKAFCNPFFGIPPERIESLPDEKKSKLATFNYEFPETGKEGVVYYALTHPCPFVDPKTMLCTQPLEVRPIKCRFYPGLIARIVKGTLILKRNIKACQRNANTSLKVKPQTQYRLINMVQEKVKIRLEDEIKVWERLYQLTDSDKIVLIIDKIVEMYDNV